MVLAVDLTLVWGIGYEGRVRIAGDGLGGRVVVEGLGRDVIWGVYEGCCRRLDGVERLEYGRLGGGLRCVVNWVQIPRWEVD